MNSFHNTSILFLHMNQLSLIHFLPEQRIQELHIQLIKGIRWVTSLIVHHHLKEIIKNQKTIHNSLKMIHRLWFYTETIFTYFYLTVIKKMLSEMIEYHTGNRYRKQFIIIGYQLESQTASTDKMKNPCNSNRSHFRTIIIT